MNKGDQLMRASPYIQSCAYGRLKLSSGMLDVEPAFEADRHQYMQSARWRLALNPI